MLIVLPACFRYVPLDAGMVQPGEDVRLVVSYDAQQGSSNRTALPAQSVEGQLVRAGDDSVAVSVWIGRDYRGTPFESTYQTFTVPRRDVLRIERRQLSKWRTGLVAVGAAVGIAVLVDRMGLIEDPNPPDDPGGPPTPPIGGIRH